ncbi:MAG: winged helix-turn-helix domain-containing protein [Halobacteria archaeon]|nr:winged helix-turn-helix domain-containing protein [Halobacteria archaeon]
MVNQDYEPNQLDDEILRVLKEGRANPYLLREETEESKQLINHRLGKLVAAGWVRKVTTGLYELVEDPRSDSDGERTEGFAESGGSSESEGEGEGEGEGDAKKESQSESESESESDDDIEDKQARDVTVAVDVDYDYDEEEFQNAYNVLVRDTQRSPDELDSGDIIVKSWANKVGVESEKLVEMLQKSV